MRAARLSHLAIKVSSLDRSEAFYGGLLGLSVSMRWQDDLGAPRSVWLAMDGEAFLAIEKAHASSPTRVDEAPGLHCLALAIAAEDRETWREKLLSAGASVERETSFSLYTRDPDGNLVALSHYPVAAS